MHLSLPSLFTVCSFVQLFFAASVSEELNKTAVKPSGAEWRWQVKSFFPSFFFSFFLHSAFKTPTLALSSDLSVVSSKQRRERRPPLWQVGSCFYQWQRWPWRGCWPFLCSQWHLQSLPFCNNTLTCCNSTPKSTNTSPYSYAESLLL